MESINIKERHGVVKVIGCLLCACGALIFTFVSGPPLYGSASASHKQSPEPSSSSWCRSKRDCIKGSVFIFLAQSAWSLWLIMQGPIVKLYPHKLRLTTLQCFFSGIQTAVWAVAMERNLSSWKIGWDMNLLATAYCGVVFTGVTYWLRVWVIEKKGPVFAAIFTPLALVITAIFSAIFWKEALHWGSVCGALLLVGGLYGVLWGKLKEEECRTIEPKTETREENV